MKKEKGENRKLTPKDFDRMWGEDGPYSQVRLCEETRILDDSVSRIFLVVEVEINPFTFEFVRERRKRFAQDEPVLQLLDHAEYRGKFGYVVSAGEVEMRDEGSVRFARRQADTAIRTLIRMHAFVMDECGLRENGAYGVIEDKTAENKRFVWNDEAGRAEPADDELWSEKTAIGVPAGVRNNKARYFIVLAFEKNFDFKKKSAIIFAKTLKLASASLQIEVENAESFQEYALITALLPFDIVPADFVEAVLGACNLDKKPILQKDYLIVNDKRPTPGQIMSFLRQLPLNRDIKMP